MFAAMEQVDVVLRINGNPAGSAKFSPAGSWKKSGRLSHWALSILLSATGLRYDGKRLNSPNDLVYKSDGALYFTDAPFGFPKFFDDPRKSCHIVAYSVFRQMEGIRMCSSDLR